MVLVVVLEVVRSSRSIVEVEKEVEVINTRHNKRDGDE